jgi:hypothetical protein
MTLDEIKDAVRAGKRVCWSNRGYEVRHWPINDEYVIVCVSNDNAIGLTWMDGVTVNGRPEEFFIDDTPHGPLSPY